VEYTSDADPLALGSTIDMKASVPPESVVLNAPAVTARLLDEVSPVTYILPVLSSARL
jgi:hypothetical protein